MIINRLNKIAILVVILYCRGAEANPGSIQIEWKAVNARVVYHFYAYNTPGSRTQRENTFYCPAHTGLNAKRTRSLALQGDDGEDLLKILSKLLKQYLSHNTTTTASEYPQAVSFLHFPMHQLESPIGNAASVVRFYIANVGYGNGAVFVNLITQDSHISLAASSPPEAPHFVSIILSNSGDGNNHLVVTTQPVNESNVGTILQYAMQNKALSDDVTAEAPPTYFHGVLHQLVIDILTEEFQINVATIFMIMSMALQACFRSGFLN